ncbi:DUF938 domain-containing protein [Thalassotalea sp. M1531]|uniref:DUF938 domain-containing protein n=1 Tax=Thalassotalea algicola TaxID=2716224 RepID=A0A7Y0L9V1_9GAMM|nr:DUF938 domain-containing protein [Thalassotalea algicola]NMP30442.1 DUF938 domain-containing protein [Thalassotalea algicola]
MKEQWHNFAPSCERNKEAIFEHVKLHCAEVTEVLELGNYSGQHASFFANKLPHLIWQCSDQQEYLASLSQNLDEHGTSNLLTPISLDVANHNQWPRKQYQLIYSANTLHIMSWQHVVCLFKHVAGVCKPNTKLIIYGPFKFDGEYTSASNADFDLWLKARDSQSAIRDFEEVNFLAEQAGFELEANIDMPANNQLVIWRFNRCNKLKSLTEKANTP